MIKIKNAEVWYHGDDRLRSLRSGPEMQVQWKQIDSGHQKVQIIRRRWNRQKNHNAISENTQNAQTSQHRRTQISLSQKRYSISRLLIRPEQLAGSTRKITRWTLTWIDSGTDVPTSERFSIYAFAQHCP